MFLVKSICSLFVLTIPILAPAAPALAQQDSLGAPVSVTGNSSGVTVAAADGLGGLITFAQNRTRRMDVDGNPLWGSDGVPISGNQVVSDGAGGAFNLLSLSPGLAVERIDGAGTVLLPPPGLTLTSASVASGDFALVPDGSGGVIIAWSTTGGDIFAQRVNNLGAVAWGPSGVTVSNASGIQSTVVLASDGAGGALVAWTDQAGGVNPDVFAQRLNAAGAPQWTASGISIAPQPGQQSPTKIISDGSGGAIVMYDKKSVQRVNSVGSLVWGSTGVTLTAAFPTQVSICTDGGAGVIAVWVDPTAGRVRAQRVTAPGIIQWPAGGVAVAQGIGAQSEPICLSDGAGGSIVAWVDARPIEDTDIYGQRLNGSGALLWGSAGTPVCTAPRNQSDLNGVLAADGGALLVWKDYRRYYSPGFHVAVYMQHLSLSGHTLIPDRDAPILRSVRDVANDQGGRVALRWRASGLDVPQTGELSYITGYRVWRRLPIDQTSFHARRSARPFLPTAPSGDWEPVGFVPAAYLPQYGYVAPTLEDSSSAGNPPTAFLVVAEWREISLFYASNMDSAYSVDNLAPAAPSGFSAQYFTGNPPTGTRPQAPGYTWLHWNQSPEPDLLEYRLHRGTSANFVPGSSNLLVAKADTGYIDVGPAGGYYKLVCLDAHGNASSSALLTPQDIVGVRSLGSPVQVWLAQAFPNPARESTVLRFGLPREADVTLAVYDGTGRRVRELIAGRLPAGEQTTRWDTRDSGGRRVPSGLYFLRLEADGELRAQRLTITR